MAKNKDKDRQKRAEKRKEKRRDRTPRVVAAAKATGGELRAELTPPDVQRCLPPIHVDRGGAIVADPRELLGLPKGGTPTEAEVREAWRRVLVERPPESDPEGSRRAREARDRLLEEDYFLERELGVLHLPDPRHWNLAPPQVPRLPTVPRLAAQAVIYALVEDAIWAEGLEVAMAARPRGWVRG